MCGRRHGFGDWRYAEVGARVPAHAGGGAPDRPPAPRQERPRAGAAPHADPDLLIGDRDRERVVELLKHATADGRLTIDEFGDRVEEVYRARTTADLRTALRQLPYRLPDPAPAAGPLSASAAAGSRGRSSARPVPAHGSANPAAQAAHAVHAVHAGLRPLLVVGLVLAIVAVAGAGQVLAAWALVWLLCMSGRRAWRS